MNALIKQAPDSYENFIGIHLFSFSLPQSILKDNEDVRISITSIPDENKQNFTIKKGNDHRANLVFSLKITEKTKKFIIVFRKNSILSNAIIASSSFHLDDFKNVPNEQITNNVIFTDIEQINLFYPLQKQKKEENIEHNDEITRRIIGHMEIQLFFSSPYLNQKQIIESKEEKKNNLLQKKKKHEKKKGYEKLSENDSNNSYLI